MVFAQKERKEEGSNKERDRGVKQQIGWVKQIFKNFFDKRMEEERRGSSGVFTERMGRFFQQKKGRGMATQAGFRKNGCGQTKKRFL